ncbi:LOW QUALITY PROTEIN: hypothetical protein Cgig2_020874 [Carnegiea gigantea]|uniref:F-box/LRR-repeat protein 15/At3g58940/PEG3-like LRR domain-containing protein n=1 Tax=Carnegiea gigantea TaxID=171969 RepID=A0A9Q1QIN7_9CARY|nr:LOW QUALITY PROTEIN: hypothetical protein Cgig2_020874 [Carnegiea gigantea]
MDEFLCGIGQVRSCLNIEELEISLSPYQSSPDKEELDNLQHGETDSAELQHFDNDPEHAFKHLHSICISSIGLITVELKLVSYLLAFSPSLMRLSFTCKSCLKATAKSLLYIQMLQFKKASPKAEILVFDYKFAKTVLANDDYNAYKWSSIISNILLLHEGSIIEFSLTIPCSISSLYPDISPGISLVSSKGVKTLSIMNEDEPLITLPSQLFFCARLEDLTLLYYGSSSLFYGNLLSLDLCDVLFEDVTFRDFMACCPVLETLRVTGCHIRDPINLTFIGAYECISFKNAPSLLSLLVYLVVDLKIIEGAVDMIKFLVGSCKLQRLCLFSEACEVLANSGISTILPTTFKQLKILKLSIAEDHMDGFLCGFGIVRSCLNIEELEIRLCMYQRSPSKEELNNFEHGETDSLELEHFDNDPECAFNHLCKIYIRRMGLVSVELKLICLLSLHCSCDCYSLANLT